jgi:hypothetical protein
MWAPAFTLYSRGSMHITLNARGPLATFPLNGRHFVGNSPGGSRILTMCHSSAFVDLEAYAEQCPT